MEAKHYLDAVTDIAVSAGERILAIYQRQFNVETKSDGSPLTEADHAAHELIVERLAALSPDIPILSEESAAIAYEQRQHWQRFWLVDPLDGTKEFVNRNGQFTVNIALIENRRPILGVVQVPVTGVVYAAAENHGAFKREAGKTAMPIAARRYTGGTATVVVSRSHRGEAVDGFLAELKEREGDYQTTDMGSSLKLCLIAEGSADIYPRLGPTSEWDTAAGQCLVQVAGGRVTDLQGAPLGYNKASILNPWFLACAAGPYAWTDYFTHVQP